MARFCSDCGVAVGFFSRKNVKRPDGSVAIVCKQCASSSTSKAASSSAIAPNNDAAIDAGIDAALRALLATRGPLTADIPAATAHLDALAADPPAADSYHGLWRVYVDAGALDRAWCVCAALTFLRMANPDEVAFFERHAPATSARVTSRMTADIWARVYHPSQDRFVSAIFATVWPTVLAASARPHKAYGLSRKDRRDVQTDTLMISKMLAYIGQALDTALPELYYQPEAPGEILLATCVDDDVLLPSLVIRQSLLSGRAPDELAFILASQLAQTRAEHILSLAVPTDAERQRALLAAISLARPDAAIGSEYTDEVRSHAADMADRMTPTTLERLAHVVSKFSEPSKLDAHEWTRGVNATCHRVGLLICGDLETAARGASAEPMVIGGPTAKDKIMDLVRYSVSDDYFFARNALGLAIRA